MIGIEIGIVRSSKATGKKFRQSSTVLKEKSRVRESRDRVSQASEHGYK